MKMSEDEIHMALQLGIQLTEENGALQQQLEEMQLKQEDSLQNISILNERNERLVNVGSD